MCYGERTGITALLAVALNPFPALLIYCCGMGHHSILVDFMIWKIGILWGLAFIGGLMGWWR